MPQKNTSDMSVANFLNAKLKTRQNYNLTSKDTRKLGVDLEQFILDRLLSGKYRVTKVDAATIASLKTKIHNAVSANAPLEFTFPFGGYKLYRLPSYPTADFAEFFTLAHYSDYLNQIAQYYAPGAVFTFSSDEVIIPKLNNLSQQDLDKYTQSFLQIIDAFNRYNPKNIVFQFQLVRDLYSSPAELWQELESYRAKTENNWVGFDEQKKFDRKRMIFLNCYFPNTASPESMNEDELNNFLKETTRIHDSYLMLSKRRAFVRGTNKIVLFSRPIPDAIPIGSTQYSTAKFWTGFGALKLDAKGSFCDVVLTPEQLKIKDYQEESVHLEALPFLTTIRIYPFTQPA